MTRSARRDSEPDRLPKPGQESAPDETNEGVERASPARDRRGRRAVTRLGRSALGPGAGEEDLVRVEAPATRGDEPDPTRHGTFRAGADRRGRARRT